MTTPQSPPEYTEEARWRDLYGKPGGSGTAMSPSWLLNGCPKCGVKVFDVTNDCWAYCTGCSKGYATEFPFTSHLLARLHPDGTTTPLGDGPDD